MAMLGSRKPTLCNLTDNPEAGPSSQRAPALLTSTMAMAPPPIAPLQNRGNRCRYNPEAGVGIIAAFMDPASTHLRIAEPIRASARGILEVTSSCCCNGCCTALYCGHRKPFRMAEFMLVCNLCCHRIGSGPLYMYKGEMAFCKPECRYDYAMQELYKERQRRASTLALKRTRRGKAKGKGKAPDAGDGKGEGCMFFTCGEIA